MLTFEADCKALDKNGYIINVNYILIFNPMPISESGPENKPIVMSRGERQRYTNLPVDDPELAKWMAEKGITFNSGFVEVELDGRRIKLNTRTEDFGTEKAPDIRITRKELEDHRDLPMDDPELIRWMAEKGIVFAEEPIEILVDGQIKLLDVRRGEGFGTFIFPDHKKVHSVQNNGHVSMP